MTQFETNKYDEEIKEYKNRLREIQKLDMNKEDKAILTTFYQNSINNMKTLNDIGVIYGQFIERGDYYFSDDFTYRISNSKWIECESGKEKTTKNLLGFEWCYLGNLISK